MKLKKSNLSWSKNKKVKGLGKKTNLQKKTLNLYINKRDFYHSSSESMDLKSISSKNDNVELN